MNKSQEGYNQNIDYLEDKQSGVRSPRLQYTPKKDYIPESPKRVADPEEELLAADKDIYAANDRTSVLLELWDWIRYILVAVILGLLLSRFVIQRSGVVGRSMEPTLHNEDQVLVDKLTVNFSDLTRGEIITIDTSTIASQEEELIVKRVIGLPGDTIDFADGRVILNGETLEENYLDNGSYTDAPVDWQGPLTLGDGEFYVLGDNRSNSADSRIMGPISEENIRGRVWIRILPLSDFGAVD